LQKQPGMLHKDLQVIITAAMKNVKRTGPRISPCFTAGIFPEAINNQYRLFLWVKIQGGPEKILLETIDPFVVNICEPPCTPVT